ncbi:MAG TPA: DUF494 domain-containing protein [Burkholderiaceae bacterium]|mgnify:CR=1 FL=1|nr:DUF494 domain-containing protein [Burkholderiaceae bacterium]
MFDVLIYFYENLRALAACRTQGALMRRLSAAGFDKNEVNKAMVWLQGLAHVARESVIVRREDAGMFRVYTPAETECLGVEAINLLIFLERAGALSAAQREIVIERALAIQEPLLGLHAFKIIVLMVIWNSQESVDPIGLDALIPVGKARSVH